MDPENRADANKIQGCDFHPGFPQIALVDTESGEVEERRLQFRGEIDAAVAAQT
jgi:hypothetical protein